jgi:hypothetical protein
MNGLGAPPVAGRQFCGLMDGTQAGSFMATRLDIVGSIQEETKGEVREGRLRGAHVGAAV